MTPEERATSLGSLFAEDAPLRAAVERVALQQIAGAVYEARESCARLAEAQAERHRLVEAGSEDDALRAVALAGQLTAMQIARQIRALPSSKEVTR